MLQFPVMHYVGIGRMLQRKDQKAKLRHRQVSTKKAPTHRPYIKRFHTAAGGG